jgi:GDP-D-mannose dehydratase
MKYITHKTLGGIGNLGSQIQQYASLYSVAKATGRTIVFPESSLDYGVDECSGEKLGFKFNKVLDIPIDIRPDDFFKDLCEYVFNKLDLDYKDYVTVDPKYFRAEELVDLKGDSTSLRKLGWKPKHDFVSLLDDMIKYWMEKDLID